MTRAFGWTLSVALLAALAALAALPAWGQDKLAPNELPKEPPRSEIPRAEPKVEPKAAPVFAPATETFVETLPPRPRFRFGGEVLQWWLSKGGIPALLNTSSTPENATTDIAGQQLIYAGTLFFNPVTGVSDKGVRVVMPGEDGISYGMLSGVRFFTELTLDDQGCWGLEGNGFLLERGNLSQTVSGHDGKPFLTRPFFDPASLVESGFDMSINSAPIGGPVPSPNPGPGLSGSLTMLARANFWGWEANAAFYPDPSVGPIAKFIGGFRALGLNEDLNVIENVGLVRNDPNSSLLEFYTQPVTSPADRIIINDFFGAYNRFYGPQAGIVFRGSRGPLTFDATMKMAVGVNHQTVRTIGSTQRYTNGVFNGIGPDGLLAVSTNSGVFTRNEFCFVPEIGLKLQLDLACWCKAHVGYNLIYLSSVVRAGDQIDRRIDPRLVPSDVAFQSFIDPANPPNLPRPFFKDTDFWVQGMNFGLEFVY